VTHEEAFLADICSRPDLDAPRLIYADWLDEHGQAERAEFIRLSCRLAGLAEDHPEHAGLLERERLLLAEHEAEWRAPLPALPGVRWGDWERGFVGEVEVLHARAFRDHADTLFAAIPVGRLCLGARFTARTVGPVMASPYLARLDSLSVYNADVGPVGAAAVAASPHLGRLANLSFGCCRLCSTGAAVLAASPVLRGLRILGLFDDRVDADGARALAESPILDGVVDLAVQTNRFGDEGAAALAASPHLGALQSLSIGYNGLGDEGTRALALSPRLPSLTYLNLVGNRIGDAGAEALAASPHLRGLRELHLGGNRIGRAGALALAASDVLGGLTQLTNYDYNFRMGREGEAALRRRFGDRVDFAPRPGR
jgi:uncharacterized protein (TIGR02996 family)